METISWKNEYSVGVELLDNHHKQLISLINRLIVEQHSVTDEATIADLLTEMTDYAQEHFRAEEYLMAEYGYEQLDNHRLIHEEFIDRTNAFCTTSNVGPNILSVQLLDYLKSWLISHILQEDMRYKTFFRDKGVQ